MLDRKELCKKDSIIIKYGKVIDLRINDYQKKRDDKMVNLIIGSDLVPTNVNIELFNKGDNNSLLGEELNDIWLDADMRIFNLETPLTNIEEPINKQGPNLKAPISTIKGIKKLNPTLVTLANNHILDQGEQGLNTTLKLFKNHGISSIGAGNNISEASKPFILEEKGITIGIYTCAEKEFTIASETRPGANPFDPLESLDHINELKKRSDFVIVLYHGGKEQYRYPSPNLQKICKKIVDKGADLVICQHSHCIGSFEKYKNSTIVYGQGNFIFNKIDNEYWNNSLLIQVNIEKNLTIDYLPVVKTEKGIKLATGNLSEEILNDFYKRSTEILQENFIELKYEELVEKNSIQYIRRIAGFGKWKSRVDRILLNNSLTKNKYDKQELLAIQNLIRCESHREFILKGLEEQINNKK